MYLALLQYDIMDAMSSDWHESLQVRSSTVYKINDRRCDNYESVMEITIFSGEDEELMDW